MPLSRPLLPSADIVLVQQSFRKVTPVADQAAALFYARLFEIEPSVRRLFSGDMEEQGRRLMTTLANAVEALDRFDTIEPTLREMGARHAQYGVRDQHYPSIGAALLWALERALGPAFTPAVKAAWSTTYSTIANAMIAGAHSVKAA
jgi:hemoglobin-like flavoprotein